MEARGSHPVGMSRRQRLEQRLQEFEKKSRPPPVPIPLPTRTTVPGRQKKAHAQSMPQQAHEANLQTLREMVEPEILHIKRKRDESPLEAFGCNNGDAADENVQWSRVIGVPSESRP